MARSPIRNAVWFFSMVFGVAALVFGLSDNWWYYAAAAISIVLILGFITSTVSNDGQGPHDRVAETRIVLWGPVGKLHKLQRTLSGGMP